jgi:hypothetical protein
VETVLANVCPNCGGGFAARPVRPAEAWRPRTGLAFDPPDTNRRHSPYSRAEIAAFAAPIATLRPDRR